jgi:tetratricopeptide (TPR) repeat protein
MRLTIGGTGWQFGLASSALILLACFATPAVNAAGTPGASAEEVPEGQTAGDTASAHYQRGLSAKERALAREAAAARADDPADRTAQLAAADAAFEEAVIYFGKALKLELDHYEAANELGYSLRKTGDYRKALGAYNFALTIKPDFYPAVEYRGEAYLALGMIERAKEAYLTLFRNEPQLAAQLLQAMAGAEVDADFSAWVEERRAIAAATPGADMPAKASW